MLFGGDSGAEAGDNAVDPGRHADGSARAEGDADDARRHRATRCRRCSTRRQVALQNKQAALAAGDWAAYGAADAQLAEIIAELIQLTAPTTTAQ